MWRDEDLNGSRFSGLSCDKALAFEGENHLVDGGRRDLEMAALIGLGGWPFVDRRIGVNEGEILALLFAESRRRKGVTAIGRSIH